MIANVTPPVLHLQQRRCYICNSACVILVTLNIRLSVTFHVPRFVCNNPKEETIRTGASRKNGLFPHSPSSPCKFSFVCRLCHYCQCWLLGKRGLSFQGIGEHSLSKSKSDNTRPVLVWHIYCLVYVEDGGITIIGRPVFPPINEIKTQAPKVLQLRRWRVFSHPANPHRQTALTLILPHLSPISTINHKLYFINCNLSFIDYKLCFIKYNLCFIDNVSVGQHRMRVRGRGNSEW